MVTNSEQNTRRKSTRTAVTWERDRPCLRLGNESQTLVVVGSTAWRVRSAERRRRHVAGPVSDRASTGAGDWAIELRESSLFDMDQKYADVIQSEEFFRAFGRRGST
jgi:hypothetical protein